MKIKVGDIVKGISDRYSITNTKMTKAVVTEVKGSRIRIAIIEHLDGRGGVFDVGAEDFSITGLVKEFNREKALKSFKTNKKALLEYDLQGANLQDANLWGANLWGAYLRGAYLRGANLDYAALPLSCSTLDMNVDDRQTIQRLYHLIRNALYSKNTSAEMKALLSTSALVEKANEFHRMSECGKIVVKKENEND